MATNPITRRRLFQQAATLLREPRLPASNHSTMPPHPGASFYTPNTHFYHVPARPMPRLDAASWRLRIGGLGVQGDLDYATLRALADGDEIACTIADGSNPRSPLIGNARWGGLPLRRLFTQFTIPEAATHVRFLTADGGVTTLSLVQLRDAWLVTHMNGASLPAEQGYPVRLLVPGLLGKALPRWVQAVELAALPPNALPEIASVAPMTTIFTPRPTETFSGAITFAGVAYAGLQAIHTVELSLDDAPWMPVSCTQPERYSWAQWSADWQPTVPGDYLLQARATTGDGTRSPVTAVVFRVAQG